MSGGRGQQVGWAVGIAIVLLGIAATRLAAGEPALGITFLSVVPIAAAATVLGRTAALATAAVALGLFLANELIDPVDAYAGGRLAGGASTRALVFVTVAVVVSELAARQRRIARLLASRDRELAELSSLRDALTPPTVPQRAGLELAVAFTPADGVVAGDFFLVAGGLGDATVLVVGDVAGHGLHAAQRASFVRASLATFVIHDSDPARLLVLANRALLDRHGPSIEFVTAVCAVLADGQLRWASAGHWPPCDLDDGAPLPAAPPSLPLGLQHDLTCTASSTPLAPGRGVLLYTDGLVEGRSQGPQPHKLYGEEAVRAELRRHHGQSPTAIAEALQQAVLRFAGGPLADDLCVLAARRTADPHAPA